MRPWTWGAVAAGVMAALFVTVIGNLDGAVQLVQAGWNDVVRHGHFTAFDFWRSSRMIPPLDDAAPSALRFWLPDRVGSTPDVSHHITEFPYFSFLFGDLHAHLVVMPFSLLALGLLLALLVGLKGGPKIWVAAVTVTLALTLGSLWVINSWDYPAYLLLTLAMLAVGAHLMIGITAHWERVWTFVVVSGATVVLSLLAFLPFHRRYDSFNPGLDVGKWQTPLVNYLGIHGLFIFLGASLLVYLARRPLKASIRWLVALPGAMGESLKPGPARDKVYRVWGPATVGLMLAGAALLAAVTGFWIVVMLLFLLGLVLLASREVFARAGDGASYLMFPVVILGFAFVIGMGVEFVRVGDDIGRMNTLFKYYLEAWMLLAVGAALALWHLARQKVFRRRGFAGFRAVWLSVVALLLFSSLIYTVLGTRDRLADRFDTQQVTLNGADFMQRARYEEKGRSMELQWDYEAIRCLQQRVRGSPVILEAHTEQYHWGGRMATYTGLPTVIGWPWHQIQQRKPYESAIHQRAADVAEVYSTVDAERALKLLGEYNVKYLVVGPLERAYYPEEGLRKFDAMAAAGRLRQVCGNEGTRVYEVRA